MFDRQTISSLFFTLTVAAATICWLLLGYDAVGEPVFDNQAALFLQLSILLPFFASVWFAFEGNKADTSTSNFMTGFAIGWVLAFGWVISTGWNLMPDAIIVLLVFLFPMGMMFLALLVLSLILCMIGFALGSFLSKMMHRKHLAS